MTALQTPALDAPGEEWGRLAVAIPDWRYMPGMVASIGAAASRVDDIAHPWPMDVRSWPDPDDPATAGCLLALLEPASPCPFRRPGGLWVVTAGQPPTGSWDLPSLPLGRACIAAAAALGRWPGGAS